MVETKTEHITEVLVYRSSKGNVPKILIRLKADSRLQRVNRKFLAVFNDLTTFNFVGKAVECYTENLLVLKYGYEFRPFRTLESILRDPPKLDLTGKSPDKSTHLEFHFKRKCMLIPVEYVHSVEDVLTGELLWPNPVLRSISEDQL